MRLPLPPPMALLEALVSIQLDQPPAITAAWLLAWIVLAAPPPTVAASDWHLFWKPPATVPYWLATVFCWPPLIVAAWPLGPMTLLLPPTMVARAACIWMRLLVPPLMVAPAACC